MHDRLGDDHQLECLANILAREERNEVANYLSLQTKIKVKTVFLIGKILTSNGV